MMRAWPGLAFVCCLSLGCGGPLGEETTPAEQPSAGDVSAQWFTPTLGKAHLVKDIFSFVPSSPLPVSGPRPQELTAFAGKLFFAANDTSSEEGGSGSVALWRTNGNASSAFPIFERTTTGPIGAVENLTAAEDQLFFFVTGPGGAELWVTDGSAGGTRQVTGPTPGTVFQRAAVGNTLFFVRTILLPDASLRIELWKSDGTPGGTRFVKALENTPFRMTAVNGKLLFILQTEASGTEPWVSDGTEAGTHVLKDINPGPDSSISGLDLIPDDGVIYFAAADPEHGNEVWRTDGTPEGTVLVADATPGPTGSVTRLLGKVHRDVYFSTTVRRERRGFLQLRKLKVTGNTSNARPVLLAELIIPGHVDESPVASVALATRDRLYVVVSLIADAILRGRQLWGTDGTPAGTELLYEPLEMNPDTPFPTLAPVDNRRIVFSAWDEAHGQELWVSDGSKAGTRLLQDIAPGAESSYPHDFTRAGPRVFFVANDGTTGYELWVLPLLENDT